MEKQKQNADTRGGAELLITRLIKAPRGLVFQAWTEPEYLAKWYAPIGCTIQINKYDVRKGGTFHTCIKNSTHGDCWCVGEFLEVISPEKLVYTIANADNEGKVINPADIGMSPDWPASTLVTITFEEATGGTLVTIHQTVSEALAKQTGAYPSWLQMLDNLEAILSSN